MQDREVLEYIQQAFEMKEQKCYKQAIELLYKVLEVEADNCEVLFQIGELYYLMGNVQRAIQYLEKVLARETEHVESLALMRKIYCQSGLYEEAERYAQTLFNKVKSSRNLAELVKIAGMCKNFDKIEEYKNSDVANDEVNCAIAQVYYEQGKIAEAKALLENIQDCEEGCVLLGKINFDEGDFEKSKEIFEKLPQSYENPEVLNYRGLFYLEDLNFVEAIKSFSKALSLDKQNARYAYNLGNAYFYNGWIKEAVQAYMQAICLAPEVVDYRYSLAYLYYETKSFDKCQKEVDYILEVEPQHANATVLNALLKFKNKDFLGAQTDLECVIKKEKNVFALGALVRVYLELSLYEKAEKILADLLVEFPEKCEYRCDLAETKIARGKFDEALKIAEEILAQNENYVDAYSLAARAAFEKGDFETAKDFAQRGISIDVNFAAGYYYLARVRMTEDDYEEAIECMKRALMYDLNNPEYYAAMAEIYKSKKDYKSALQYANEATELDNSTKYKVLYGELAGLNRNFSQVRG